MLYLTKFTVVTCLLEALITQIMLVESSSDMAAVFTRCKEEASATEDDIKTFKAQQIPNTMTGKCMLACMFDHSGLMKEGKYDSDGALKLVGQVFSDNPLKLGKAKQLINRCTEEVRDEKDKCEIASKIADCTVRMSTQVGLA